MFVYFAYLCDSLVGDKGKRARCPTKYPLRPLIIYIMYRLRYILLHFAVLIILLHSFLPHSHARYIAEQSANVEGASYTAHDLWQSVMLLNPAPEHLEHFYPEQGETMPVLAWQIDFERQVHPLFCYRFAYHALPVGEFLLQLYRRPSRYLLDYYTGFDPIPAVLPAARALRAPPRS